MRVKYRCPIKGRIRVQFSFELPANPIQYELETGEHGELTYVSASISVTDRALWPTARPSNQSGIALNINLRSPFFDVVRKDLRSAEGMLVLFGLESIDTESAEEIWLPDTPEEKRELELYSFKRTKELRPIQEMPYTSFDLVARAFLSAHLAHDIESALSFFRKGRTDVIEARYIEAVFDFLFMVESLYANGKFKSAQVEQEYLSNSELQQAIKTSITKDSLQQNITREARVKQAFLRDYFDKSPREITKHLVQLRGFLHHHSKDKKGIWHPNDHLRYGADAFFLQQLCYTIGFNLIDPVLFAPEHVRQYQELARAFERNKKTRPL